jgi:acetyl-CoA C-acetyltransferase
MNMESREVVFVSAVRTAIGAFGGSLKDIPLTTLATVVVKQALERSGVEPADVGHVVMGNVIPTTPQDAYLSRVAAIDSGIPAEVPAMNVNRLCGSGLQAIISAAQSILLGDTDVAIAGGAESMSRGPYLLPDTRWGSRLGDGRTVDYMNGILHDPWKHQHMGVTAENIAERYAISREEQDETALASHAKAARASQEGRFKTQIVPVTVTAGKLTKVFDVDEHFRPHLNVTDLSKLKPAFVSNGTVTAGNSSGLNDGAAAVVLVERGYADAHGLKPLARLVGYAHAGVDPDYMGMGPVPAIQKLLAKTRIQVHQLDVIEINEAFAAQVCAVIKALELDPIKVNPNGSGISLGHPVGATGAMITVKAIHELQRTSGRYALVSLCIGGGQGISALLERI